MPIRPENRDRYPPEWERLVIRLKDQAGWRCECAGECGRPHDHLDVDDRCPNVHGEPARTGRGKLVILTVAHLNHTPEDNTPENLRVLCQGCHLHYDEEHHRQSRVVYALQALEAAGQLRLLA